MSLSSEIISACDRVLAAAGTGVYQGIVLALLVGLGLRVLGRTNAATRHAIWFATLGLVACLIPAHCLRDHLTKALRAPAREASSLVWSDTSPPQKEQPGLVPVSRDELARLDEWVAATTLPVLLENSIEGDQNLVTAEKAQVQPRTANPATEAGELQTASSGFERAVEFVTRVKQFLQPISWVFTPGSTLPQMTSFVLLAFVLVGGIVRGGLLIWRLCEIRKLKAKAVPANGAVAELFERLRRQLGVSRRVELKLSSEQRSPVLLGFFRPVVLLPAGQLSDAGEAEAILRHELAHVCRRDDWTNLAQQVIQAILFFHPAVWWICRQTSIQREIACDDYVLEQGGRPRAYALLLADLASRINARRALLAPGVTTSKSQLQERIDMILNTHRDTSPRLAKSRLGLITSSAALMAALALYAAPRLVLAQAPAPVEPALPNPPAPPAPALNANNQPSATLPEVPAGPKVKSRNSVDRVAETIVLATPAVSASPAVVAVQAVPAHPSHNVAAPRPAAAPRAPRPPETPEAEASFEQRLRRLERMVESLLQQRDPKQLSKEYSYKDGPRPELRIEKEMIVQLQETAKREAERQVDQAKRATRDAEKSLRLRQERDAKGKLSQEATKQLEALHEQRAMLEREVEKVERQIERLEQEQEKLHEQKQSQLLEERAGEAYGLALLEEKPCPAPAEPGVALLKK